MCLSFLTVPAAPTDLSLTNPGSSSELYASWNKPPGRRDHYRVVLYSFGTQGRERVQTLPPDSQNITWTHLEAGSRFAVQVTAVKGSFEASTTNVTQWTCECNGLGWTLHCAPEPCRAPTATFPIPNQPCCVHNFYIVIPPFCSLPALLP